MCAHDRVVQPTVRGKQGQDMSPPCGQLCAELPDSKHSASLTSATSQFIRVLEALGDRASVSLSLTAAVIRLCLWEPVHELELGKE